MWKLVRNNESISVVVGEATSPVAARLVTSATTNTPVKSRRIPAPFFGGMIRVCMVAVIATATVAVAVADDAPSEPSVLVKCCGRLRHGVMAIGGESTGTTITFNRVIWELQLDDDAERDFAQRHNKEPVVVIGSLRRISGIEVRDRWIVDVRSLAECDDEKDREGTLLRIQGTLRAADFRTDESSGITIHADDQSWPLDFSSDELRRTAESLIGQPVLLGGSLERITEDESNSPLVVRVKKLKQSTSDPAQRHSH